MTKEELDYIRSREAIGGYRGVERIRLKQLIAHIDELEKEIIQLRLFKPQREIELESKLQEVDKKLEEQSTQLRQAKQELREIATYQGQDLTIPLHLQSLIMIIQSKAKSALAALEGKDQ